MTQIQLLRGDCREILRTLPDNSADAIITDPPYELGFMGQTWDRSGIAYDPTVWRECCRVLKPGAWVLAFGGTRTYHRLACAIEDAGLQIRDMIHWVYSSGFPKSHDVSKAIDRHLGAVRGKIRVPATAISNPKAVGGGKDGRKGATRPWIQKALAQGYHDFEDNNPVTDQARTWSGWGTGLKPAHEPIALARKPLAGTVAQNTLAWGVGGLNVGGCRVGDEVLAAARSSATAGGDRIGQIKPGMVTPERTGRWPANLAHDGSHAAKGALGGDPVARFFTACPWQAADFAPVRYAPKPGKTEKGAANKHPTVKPLSLVQWLITLVTMPGALVVDPFVGSGTTALACQRLGRACVGIDLDPEYLESARARLAGDPGEPEDAAGETARQAKLF